MGLTPDVIVALMVLAPFVAAATAPALHRVIGHFTGWALALVPLGIAWVMLPMLTPITVGDVIRTTVPWVPTLGVEFSFFIDGLSLTFAFLILGIGAAILIYSASHLRGHPHQGRFVAYLMLFMGAMLGLVLADDMVVLFTFWELTTVASFLLIGFDHRRQAARRAAIQAMLVTTFGGLALLAGAILLRTTTGSWEISALGDVTQAGLYPAVLVAVLLAAFTKSAQVPFHFWLPNAMDAPTPVSAYLHSATMVQAGIYLLLRMTPALGGTAAWTAALTAFGGLTLIWGAVAAFRQTDLKLMLAYTTVASLGLMVALIGVGTETAIIAAIVYFVAHALYKATLFLVVGLIEHETGLRDVTALGGLRERMAVTFIAAVFAAISMIGFPPALGYFAKEEIYRSLSGGDVYSIALIVVVVAGNAALGAIALAMMIKPFMGAPVSLPKAPREGPFGMLLAVAVLAAAGLVAGWQADWIATSFVSPATTRATGVPAESHLVFSPDPFNPALWLSVVTWSIALMTYRLMDPLRAIARRAQLASGLTFDQGFDWGMFGLIRLAAATTRIVHHGRLELYLVVVFAAFVVALAVPLWAIGGVPPLPEAPALTIYEWGVLVLAALGIAAVVLARTRLLAIVALGVQGLAVALVYMLFGAPDLSFTQFMIEVLSVVILALVMTKLRLETEDHRILEDLLRDGGLAILCGIGTVLLLLAVLRGPFDPRLGEFFAAASYPLAHGRNIVNVILVDFRGLDTLGEIAVLLAAGVAVLTLLRRQAGGTPSRATPAPSRRKARRSSKGGTRPTRLDPAAREAAR